MRSLLLDVRVGEIVSIGETVVSLLDKSGQRVRLRIVAPESVKVTYNERGQGHLLAKRGVLAQEK